MRLALSQFGCFLCSSLYCFFLTAAALDLLRGAGSMIYVADVHHYPHHIRDRTRIHDRTIDGSEFGSAIVCLACS
ncbi:hypothetical protein BS78_10G186700 [Paspalum vaginatum]|nr:hypothetical protein BS78_10G186700 [Paspalum vaginatum]